MNFRTSLSLPIFSFTTLFSFNSFSTFHLCIFFSSLGSLPSLQFPSLSSTSILLFLHFYVSPRFLLLTFCFFPFPLFPFPFPLISLLFPFYLFSFSSIFHCFLFHSLHFILYIFLSLHFLLFRFSFLRFN